MNTYDILIRNGLIYDPLRNNKQQGDLAVCGKRICKIGQINGTASKEIDASGCLVVPGLIDLHMHLFPYSDVGVVPDLMCLPNGITSACDGGSTGWGNYEFHRYYSSLRKVTVKNFVNCSGVGLSVHGFPDQMNLNLMDGKGKKAIRRLFEEYRDELAGIKLLIRPQSMRDYGEEPLFAALELAEELQTVLMIHISGTTIPVNRLASLVRPGDILTHCYNNNGMTILDEAGQVTPEVWEAQKRGVIFDVGNARKHFSFSVALRALKQGFLPNTISTDTTVLGAYRKPEMCCLPWVMSKFLAMGMTIEQVIACCTSSPAHAVFFRESAGAIYENGLADIAVLKPLAKKVIFTDSNGESVAGNTLIKPVATIKSGELLWRDIEY